jgi:wobble nucleotide-excising tRNase
MITKINSLSSFGNYRQFQWGSNFAFSKRNLIYGWNYSGKTTLSRFFQVLADQNNLAKFPGCKFEIERQGGAKLTQANFTSNPSIKVFNRDFIQENFQQEHKAPAVFIVGGNAIHLRKRIARLNTHAAKTKVIESGLSASQARLKKELDSIGTSQASSIATLTVDKTYNRPKLLADIDQVRANPVSFLLNDPDLQAKVSLLRTTQVWEDISTAAYPTVQIETLRSNLENTVQKTASNEAIVKLKENRELESWIRTGLAHHKDSTQCEFCGSTIQDDRLSALQKHFSKAYEDLTSEVADQLIVLEGSLVQVTLPDERDLMPDLREQFFTLKGKLNAWVAWANGVIGELLTLAKNKQLALETQFNCVVDTSRSLDVAQVVVDINALIATHNKRRLQIHTEKNVAKTAIERHHAASCFQTENILAKETAIASIEAEVTRAKNLLAAITDKKSVIETLVQQQSIAAKKINETIHFLLPDNNISVAEVPGGSFEFRRDNVPASNLSDGEKTAITFAYFLASLENNGASLSQATVFIDDPISSLDSNHIYAIYALITKRLDSCQQVFVSTHNSELYTLLKDAWFDTRQQFANRINESSAYYARRFLDAKQNWHSTLEDLPLLLRKYKSEYQFIFEQLHTFSNSPSASLHEAYTAPNMLRKFLEAYLGFNKPCVPAWSKKLDLLFDTDVEQTEIQKFSDDASHLQSLDRALQQPDFVTNAQNTVKKVIQALKAKDLPHYTSMCKVIGVTP